ncbi:molybdopterin biosynthesis protein [Texcoconibacillus texcoconensis]|uniref:Molybdopterin molybdenumtransferase n=1 Tax=Texcoconibacillus texcoconensis TaxID=1095777 RepID=A0A840QNB3_9BACI|nr:putative molybdopterin biosynthesis protein [Texcoconibacillus texcoconensis]
MNGRKNKRTIYLEDKPRQQAQQELLEQCSIERNVEYIASQKAVGRVTAFPIYASLSMPHYHASAMDGIAVRADQTKSAHEQQPLLLKKGDDFVFVDTGDPIPDGFNAVIMIEHVNEVDTDTMQIIEPATPWQHIRPVGEDVTYGEMLFPQDHELRSIDLGALLAAGIIEIPVLKRPTVSIIPTGNELVYPTLDVSPGDIIEFNGTVFASQVEEWGGCAKLQDIAVDDWEAISESLMKASRESDVVIINAGSSAGSKDYTAQVINELGTVYTHGVATRPGKPVVIGEIDSTPIIGVPGYPVSAYLAMEWFVRPLLCQYYGKKEPKRNTVRVKLGRRIVSTMGAEDFVRMNIGYVNGQFIANPLTRAAGVTMSLVRADGLLVIPPEQLGYEQGEEVDVELLRPLPEIESTFMFSGSHDLMIDILRSCLRKEHQRDLSISHTGSMSGILAIKNEEAHISGVHLLDPATGIYNETYVKQMLPDQDVVLLPFLKREQGLIVNAGNPLGVETIHDLTNASVQYINRQRGAGTRILLDHLLKYEKIDVEEVNGYEREMFTHLSVAAEVRSDQHNVGLGIRAAADAMGLDFIPVAEENYDLLMTRAFYESESGQELINTIESESFRQQVNQFDGYRLSEDREPRFYRS